MAFGVYLLGSTIWGLGFRVGSIQGYVGAYTVRQGLYIKGLGPSLRLVMFG